MIGAWCRGRARDASEGHDAARPRPRRAPERTLRDLRALAVDLLVHARGVRRHGRLAGELVLGLQDRAALVDLQVRGVAGQKRRPAWVGSERTRLSAGACARRPHAWRRAFTSEKARMKWGEGGLETHVEVASKLKQRKHKVRLQKRGQGRRQVVACAGRGGEGGKVRRGSEGLREEAGATAPDAARQPSWPRMLPALHAAHSAGARGGRGRARRGADASARRQEWAQQQQRDGLRTRRRPCAQRLGARVELRHIRHAVEATTTLSWRRDDGRWGGVCVVRRPTGLRLLREQVHAPRGPSTPKMSAPHTQTTLSSIQMGAVS